MPPTPRRLNAASVLGQLRLGERLDAGVVVTGEVPAVDGELVARPRAYAAILPSSTATPTWSANLAVLAGYRTDLIADRVRMINRLRELMTSVFPSLEREFDYSSCKGALVLLTGYASPERIRRIGQTRLTSWLRHRRVRDFAGVAARAVAAARAQLIVLPGQDLTASIIAELATNILALDERVKNLDTQIAASFDQHPQAAVIQSMPGFGRACHDFPLGDGVV